jgi:hypothetical protein
VVFVDGAGVRRTLHVVSAPFGLDASEVRASSLPVEILDDAGASSGLTFYVMHPVLCMESRVHNIVGLPAHYGTEQGLKQARASILFAREFLRDVLDGKLDAEDPVRAVLQLDERIFRFAVHNTHAKELYRAHHLDPSDVILDG